MHRFFVPPSSLGADHAHIRGEAAHQIARVLRMQQGDRICLLDGQGWEYYVNITFLGKDEVVGAIMERIEGKAEPRHKVTLYLSLLNKADKFEWALQKCTELGATAFVPVRSARSIADAPGPSKTERWQRIIQEAAEQSGRAVIPMLAESVSFSAALKDQASKLALIPALEAEAPLARTLDAHKTVYDEQVSILIGPEGGFTHEEVEAAQVAGVHPVTLGPRTLRAETAAVASLTMVLYELGEMEGRQTTDDRR